MDKLVVQVTRQLQAIMCNEPCAKLLSLFMYETVRPQGMLENVYLSSLLSPSLYPLLSLPHHPHQKYIVIWPS